METGSQAQNCQILKCRYYIEDATVPGRIAAASIVCRQPAKTAGFPIDSMLRFKTIQERKDYVELFCFDRYEQCPFYKRKNVFYGV